MSDGAIRLETIPKIGNELRAANEQRKLHCRAMSERGTVTTAWPVSSIRIASVRRQDFESVFADPLARDTGHAIHFSSPGAGSTTT